MTDEILDSDLYLEGFIPPRVFLVENESWISLCKTLEKQSFKFVGILFLITILLYFFFGFLFLLISFIISLITIYHFRKKYIQLRLLAGHTYSISNTHLTHYFNGNKRRIAFEDIKDIIFWNWGIEVQSKSSKKHFRSISIPCRVNDYHVMHDMFESFSKKK